MKRFLLLLLISAIAFSACKSNKNYLQRSDEDKALQDAVKRLSKDADDYEAREAIPILYRNIAGVRTARIRSYQSSTEIAKWDKIINEYNQLQSAYNSIINSSAAFRLITPENYSTQLLETRQRAAEAYYTSGDAFFNQPGRDNAKRAYNAYKKTSQYIPNYKDAAAKMNEAYENAIVDVVINPVQDNSFFNNNGWGNSWNSYSNDYFQRALIRDLDYNNGNNTRYAARFYSDWEIRNKNINPDWEVNLLLRNMDIPSPRPYSQRYNRSASVEIGKDTSGRPIYQTVTASVNISRYSFTAYANMDVQIKDLTTRQSISNRSFREDYRWEESRGNYSGDSRALTSQDWEAINNNRFNEPSRNEVVEELYRKLYNQILSHIRYSVQW
jgi:hypothetical protein